MAATMRADSRAMYSWWWDSHVSPKNSKWLQQNLTDMDAKVKQMIKLIEEDADSFARRAEMYYEKRPELMKLVEEFYRAYRALAERYDHATVVIQQTHRTMAEAFPNQVPVLLSNDSSETDAHFPQLSPPSSNPFDLDDSVMIPMGLNELFASEEAANQGHGLHDMTENERNYEQATRIQGEVHQGLKERLTKLEEYEQLMDRACRAELEVEILKERSNQSVQSELEFTVQKMESLSEELAEKKKEISRLWTCIQEERLRYFESQTALQSLKILHSKTQADLRSMASEIQIKTQNLKDMETQIQALENAVQKVEEEKKSLKELYLSSVISMNNLEVEIERLKEKTKKLEEEVESVGLNPDCFGSSVKALQNENSKLREISEMDKSERTALLEKMKIMGELLDKNDFLEISVSSLHAELERVTEKVAMLENSCQALLKEKVTLVAERTSMASQLQSVTEKNMGLENSLSDLTMKSNCLEESCFFLNRERSRMINEREKIESKLEISMKSVEDQKKRYIELEENHLGLIREREYALCEVEEAQNLLEATKREHASLSQLAQKKLSAMETHVCQLQEEGDSRRKKSQEEFEKSSRREKELRGDMIETQQVLRLMQSERTELCEMVEMLTNKYVEVKLRQEHQGKETAYVYELKTKLERILKKLVDEIEKHKSGFESLSFKLEEERNEADVWLEKLQLSAVREAFFHGKIIELVEAYEKEIKMLKEENRKLGFENEWLRSEKLNANTSLEIATKEIEEIESGSRLRRENRNAIKHPSSQRVESKRVNRGVHRPKSEEISETWSEVLMKDIKLDQVSSRVEIREADNHMLELWESTNKDGSFDLMLGNSKGKHASINALIEKELSHEKLEISKRLSAPTRERNRKRIVERLDSDALRLINLQITLQDLKKKTKCVENDEVKLQLEEAEAAMLKLSDINCKLKKSTEGGSMAMAMDGSASVRNRIVWVQARRGSEKIGQLQLELQKLQFLLLKLEDEKMSRSRTRVTERSQRVLLKDYLYGGKRTPGPGHHRQKKAPFCACVQAPSRGDWSN